MSDMLCARRYENLGGPFRYHPGPDTWRVEPNGDRTCSYCGSLHFDDFMRLVADAAQDGSLVHINLSDKNYKIYVEQPGVKCAGEGGIKFYKQHLPDTITDEQKETYLVAVRKSRARFEERFNAHREGKAASV